MLWYIIEPKPFRWNHITFKFRDYFSQSINWRNM